LEVTRQYPLVLQAEVHLIEGKALGSEKVKGLGCSFFYEQTREFENRLHCV
jgi:hypothetical protein